MLTCPEYVFPLGAHMSVARFLQQEPALPARRKHSSGEEEEEDVAPPPADREKRRHHALKAFVFGGIPARLLGGQLNKAYFGPRGPMRPISRELHRQYDADWRTELLARTPKTLPDGTENILHSPARGVFSPHTSLNDMGRGPHYNFPTTRVAVPLGYDWKVGAHEYGHKLDFTSPKGIVARARTGYFKSLKLQGALGLGATVAATAGGVTGNEGLLAAGLATAALPWAGMYVNEVAANRRAETLLRPEHVDEYRAWAKNLQLRGYRRGLPALFAFKGLAPLLGMYGMRKHLDRRNPRASGDAVKETPPQSESQ